MKNFENGDGDFFNQLADPLFQKELQYDDQKYAIQQVFNHYKQKKDSVGLLVFPLSQA